MLGWLRVFIGLAAISMVMSCQKPKPAHTDITLNFFFPPTHFSKPIFQAWADDVKAATNGEVRIAFTAKSVSPPPGILGAVRNGLVDAGFMYSGFAEQAMPGGMISQMPWLHRGDSAALSAEFWASYEANFSDIENMRGIKFLSAFHLGPTYLCSVNETPISSMEDLRGRRIWALPGTVSDTLRGMDLAISSGPAVQLQELVSRNTVDAHLGLTKETMIGFGVAPYTKSCVETLPSLQSASFMIFMNRNVWNGLSADNQARIEALSGQALARRLGQGTNAAEIKAGQRLEQMGITFTNMPADVKQAMEIAGKDIRQVWMNQISKKYDLDGAKILDELNRALEDRANNTADSAVSE